ncbi:hypothetical protein [Pseudoduganella namucuonensis]|nr:hypothetical protein [Pseudoduganella namucuonensis]
MQLRNGRYSKRNLPAPGAAAAARIGGRYNVGLGHTPSRKRKK